MTDKEAIEALTDKTVVNPYLTLEALEIAIDALRERAERKTGKWIDGHSTCSICKWYPTNRYGFVVRADYNYCPNCGVEMEDSIWRQTNDRR